MLFCQIKYQQNWKMMLNVVTNLFSFYSFSSQFVSLSFSPGMCCELCMPSISCCINRAYKSYGYYEKYFLFLYLIFVFNCSSKAFNFINILEKKRKIIFCFWKHLLSFYKTPTQTIEKYWFVFGIICKSWYHLLNFFSFFLFYLNANKYLTPCI